jgi:hypothetical protein
MYTKRHSPKTQARSPYKNGQLPYFIAVKRKASETEKGKERNREIQRKRTGRKRRSSQVLW